MEPVYTDEKKKFEKKKMDTENSGTEVTDKIQDMDAVASNDVLNETEAFTPSAGTQSSAVTGLDISQSTALGANIDLAAFLQKASVPEQNSNSLSSKTNANQPGQSSLISQQIVPPMQTNVAPRPQTYDFNQYAKEASESIKAAVGVGSVQNTPSAPSMNTNSFQSSNSSYQSSYNVNNSNNQHHVQMAHDLQQVIVSQSGFSSGSSMSRDLNSPVVSQQSSSSTVSKTTTSQHQAPLPQRVKPPKTRLPPPSKVGSVQNTPSAPSMNTNSFQSSNSSYQSSYNVNNSNNQHHVQMAHDLQQVIVSQSGFSSGSSMSRDLNSPVVSQQSSSSTVSKTTTSQHQAPLPQRVKPPKTRLPPPSKNLKPNQLASGATTARVKPKEPSLPIEIINLSDEEMEEPPKLEPAVPDAKSVIISSSPALSSLSTSTAHAFSLRTCTIRYLTPVVRPKTQSTDASISSESRIKLKRYLESPSTKGDSKKKKLATTLQPKHGLQSLGKVGTRCRMPPPANLPSLKSENSGNNPNISLVPSGGSGWGSATKEKAKSTTEETNGGQQPSPKSQPTSSLSQTTPKTSTRNTVSTSGRNKTWSSVTSSQEDGGQERNFLGQQLPFFPREFPKLAGGYAPTESNQKSSADTQYGPGPSLRPQNEEESRNTTSPSEAVTSTTNANLLSSEPLNFESAPSCIHIFYNNHGQLEGCLRQFPEGVLNTLNSVFGSERISRKEYPTVKDNSGFKFSSSLQNSQTKESAPEPEKKNSFISNPLHLEESSKEKLTEAVITSSSSNVPNPPVTACFGFTTKPIESKDTRENKPSVFKLTSESPSLSAFKSPVNLFKFGGEKADSTKNSLSSSSVTLATTTTTASFGFSSSGSTLYTDPWYGCTWFGTNPKITEVTSTTANSNPVTIKTEENKTVANTTVCTAVATSSPFVFGSSITSSTPSAFSFLTTSAAAATTTTTASTTTTSVFSFGASSNQYGGILNGDHLSTPNLPLLGAPESEIHLLNSVLGEVDSLTVNNKADYFDDNESATLKENVTEMQQFLRNKEEIEKINYSVQEMDCEAILKEGSNITDEAPDIVPPLSDPEEWEAYEPAVSELILHFDRGDELDYNPPQDIPTEDSKDELNEND